MIKISKFTKEDIKTIFQWMDNNRYKVETVEKYRAVIKKFYKMRTMFDID